MLWANPGGHCCAQVGCSHEHACRGSRQGALGCLNAPFSGPSTDPWTHRLLPWRRRFGVREREVVKAGGATKEASAQQLKENPGGKDQLVQVQVVFRWVQLG